MTDTIPTIIELLYRGMVPGPNPNFWPEHMKNNPIMAHGLWTFYSGLKMGLQLGAACLQEN